MKIWTIIKRLNSGKVLLKDVFGRTKVITAGTEYSKGDEVLVSNGVISSKIRKSKIWRKIT